MGDNHIGFQIDQLGGQLRKLELVVWGNCSRRQLFANAAIAASRGVHVNAPEI